MTWEQRYRWRYGIRTSLVPWTVLALLAALITAPVVRSLDHHTGWKVFGYSPEGARSILGALVASLLTFIVFVLSSTLIVVQLASGQLTSRIIAMVFAIPLVRFTLALFTFSFAHTLGALARIEDPVPDFHVSVAVLLNLLCIVVFFLFVQRLASGLRPSKMMLTVAERGREVFEQVYPQLYLPDRPEETGPRSPLMQPVWQVEHTGRSGVVLAFSAAELVDLARQSDVVIELVPQVGDWIAPGDPLFRVSGRTGSISAAALRGCVAVGPERTMDQDPRFVFRILVDIASRALSPAVNDPTTAVIALDRIGSLLLFLGRRRLDEGEARDRDDRLRLVYGTPDWADFVALAVSEIRQYGAGSIQVARRLRAMLEHLLRELPESRRPALTEELVLLESSLRRCFPNEVDRKRAEVADPQGIGGSES